ncbi:YDG domain-containing protein [Pseudomonas poae]
MKRQAPLATPWPAASRALNCEPAAWLRWTFRVNVSYQKPALHSVHLAMVVSLLMVSTPGVALEPGTLPTGGKVVGGQALLQQQGNQLVVEQHSDRAILDWQSFDIGQNARVRFNQPGANATALNRVTGGGGQSLIQGSLSANGRVYLVNGAGVLFGPSAQVNTGGLVASTLDIANEDFLAGRDRFVITDQSKGEVVNQGHISARNGTVALLGRTVGNTGSISADNGNVVLAGGQEVSFAAGADGHLQIAVSASELQSSIRNGGAIYADGGQIVLNAQGANALASAVVSNTGTLQAHTVAEREGKILLLADLEHGGRAEVAGTLDASAINGGNGGFVETSGAQVQIAPATRVTTQAPKGRTGKWLVDPTDFTVSAGGQAQTTSGIGADTLVSNLASTNILLQTDAQGSEPGDLNIQAPISWNAATTLSLLTLRDLNINAPISAVNGGLTLSIARNVNVNAAIDVGTFNFLGGTWIQNSANLPTFQAHDFRLNGGSFLRANGGDGSSSNPYLLTDVYGVQGMQGFLSSHFKLANDIQAVGTQNWNCDSSCSGFVPIGNFDRPFTGSLDGGGQLIDKLQVSVHASSQSTNAEAGLFGTLGSGAHVTHLGLTDGFFSASGGNENFSGSLAARNLGSIESSYSTGSVTTGDANADANFAGGLVGNNTFTTVNGIVQGGTISGSYSTASVIASEGKNSAYAGGLVGTNAQGTIYRSYATGSASASDGLDSNYAGGLVANNVGTVQQSYALGSATALRGNRTFVGGLLGQHSGNAITDSFYATTDSSGAGINNASNYNSFGIGKSRSELTTLSTFQNWDIDATGGTGRAWRLYEGQTTPLLRSFLKPVNATVNDNGRVYDGSTATVSGNGFTLSASSAQVLGTPTYASTSARNAGAYALSMSGLYSDQFGYDISYVQGTYTISQRAIGGAFTADNKVYDGTTTATVHGGLDSNTVVAGDDLSVTTSGLFADKNVGQGKAVSVLGSLTGADAGNYQFIAPSNGSVVAAITPRTIGGAFTADNKVYDGTSTATVHGGLDSNTVVADDDLSVTTNGLFADKNVGQGKAVSVFGSLTGADAGNYQFTAPSNVVAAITPRTIGGAFTADNKVYDGTTSATVHGGLDSNTVVAGDDLNVTTNGLFADKNVGQGKAVSVLGSLTGADAGNYQFIAPSNGSVVAAITPRTIGGAFTADNKVYDGTSTATVHGGLDSNTVVADDDLSVTTNGLFADKNVGQGKAVSVFGSLTGADAGNYQFTAPSNVVAAITPRTIGGAFTADNKVYDGTSTATVHGGLDSNTVVADDDLSVTTNGLFADKNVGQGKAVSVFGSLTGADAGNYQFTAPSNVVAAITPRTIGGAFTADNKVYDGTTSATVHGGLDSNTVVAGDDLNVTTNGLFADKNVGQGKAVSVLGSLTGADAGNYQFIAPSNGSVVAAITPRTIGGAFTADNKVYDGTSTATVHGGLDSNTVVAGDDLSVTTNGLFADKNVGQGKAVSVFGSLTGADAGNYQFIAPSNGIVVAAVTPRTIGGAFTADNKVYDGTTTVTVHGSLDSNTVVAGDDLNVTTSGLFADKNVGQGKAVSVLGSLTGADAGNYQFIAPSNGSVVASILPATLKITANDQVVPWSGRPYSGGNGVRYAGFVAGEDANELAGLPLRYAGSAKNAVVAGTYSIAPVGPDTFGNYAIAYENGSLQIIPTSVSRNLVPPPAGEIKRSLTNSEAIEYFNYEAMRLQGDDKLWSGRYGLPLKFTPGGFIHAAK